MKFRMHLFAVCFFVMVLISGCATRIGVTPEVLETVGHELFSNFRFYVSKDIVLRRKVILGEHLEQTGPGTITVSNFEINLRRSTIGRFQRDVPPDRLEIFFEELPDGNRPTLTFLRDIKGGTERYFIETMPGEGFIVDAMGTYGYAKIQGDIVTYNGVEYFLFFIGNEKPFLLQELDVSVINQSREMRGMR